MRPSSGIARNPKKKRTSKPSHDVSRRNATSTSTISHISINPVGDSTHVSYGVETSCAPRRTIAKSSKSTYTASVESRSFHVSSVASCPLNQFHASSLSSPSQHSPKSSDKVLPSTTGPTSSSQPSSPVFTPTSRPFSTTSQSPTLHTLQPPRVIPKQDLEALRTSMATDTITAANSGDGTAGTAVVGAGHVDSHSLSTSFIPQVKHNEMTQEERIIHFNTITSPRVNQARYSFDVQNDDIFGHNRTLTILQKRIEYLHNNLAHLPEHPSNIKLKVQDIINEIQHYYTAHQSKIAERLGCEVQDIINHTKGQEYISRLNTQAILLFREYTHRLLIQQADKMSKGQNIHYNARQQLQSVPIQTLVDKVNNSIVHEKPISLNDSAINELTLPSPEDLGRKLRRSDLIPLTTTKEHMEWIIDDMKAQSFEQYVNTTLDPVHIGHLLASIDPYNPDLTGQIKRWHRTVPLVGKPQPPTSINYRELYAPMQIIRGMKLSMKMLSHDPVAQLEAQIDRLPKRISFPHLLFVLYPQAPEFRVKFFDAVLEALPHNEFTFRAHTQSYYHHQRALWKPHFMKYAGGALSPTQMMKEESIGTAHHRRGGDTIQDPPIVFAPDTASTVSSTTVGMRSSTPSQKIMAEQERYWVQEGADRYESVFLSDKYCDNYFSYMKSLLASPSPEFYASQGVLSSTTISSIVSAYNAWLFPKLLHGYARVESARDVMFEIHHALYQGENYVEELCQAYWKQQELKQSRHRALHGADVATTMPDHDESFRTKHAKIIQAITVYHEKLAKIAADPHASISPHRRGNFPFTKWLNKGIEQGTARDQGKSATQSSEPTRRHHHHQQQHHDDSIYSIFTPAELRIAHNEGFYPQLENLFHHYHEEAVREKLSLSHPQGQPQQDMSPSYISYINSITELGPRRTALTSSVPIAHLTDEESLSTLKHYLSLGTQHLPPPDLTVYEDEITRYSRSHLTHFASPFARKHLKSSDIDDPSNTSQTTTIANSSNSSSSSSNTNTSTSSSSSIQHKIPTHVGNEKKRETDLIEDDENIIDTGLIDSDTEVIVNPHEHAMKNLFGDSLWSTFHPLGYRYAHLERDRLRVVMCDLRHKKTQLVEQLALLKQIIDVLDPVELKFTKPNPLANVLADDNSTNTTNTSNDTPPHRLSIQTKRLTAHRDLYQIDHHEPIDSVGAHDTAFHPGIFDLVYDTGKGMGDDPSKRSTSKHTLSFYSDPSIAVDTQSTSKHKDEDKHRSKTPPTGPSILGWLQEDFTDDHLPSIYDNTFTRLTFDKRTHIGYHSHHYAQPTTPFGSTMSYSMLMTAYLTGNLPLAEALLSFGASPTQSTLNLYRRSALYFQYVNSHLFHSHLGICLSSRYYERATTTNTMLTTTHIQAWFDSSYFFRLKGLYYIFLRNIPRFQTILYMLYTFPHAMFNLDNISRTSFLHNLTASHHFTQDAHVKSLFERWIASRQKRMIGDHEHSALVDGDELSQLGDDLSDSDPAVASDDLVDDDSVSNTMERSPSSPFRPPKTRGPTYKMFTHANLDQWTKSAVGFFDVLRQCILHPHQLAYWNSLLHAIQANDEQRYNDAKKAHQKGTLPPRPIRPYLSYSPLQLALDMSDALGEYYTKMRDQQLARLSLRIARGMHASLEEAVYIIPQPDRPLPQPTPPGVDCTRLTKSYLDSFGLPQSVLSLYALPPKGHALYTPILQQLKASNNGTSNTNIQSTLHQDLPQELVGILQVQPQSSDSLQSLRHLSALSPSLLFIRDIYGSTPFDTILKRFHTWDSFQLMIQARCTTNPKEQPASYLDPDLFYQHHSHLKRKFAELNDPVPPPSLKPSPYLHKYKSKKDDGTGGDGDSTPSTTVLNIDLDNLDPQGSFDDKWVDYSGRFHQALSAYHNHAFGGTSAEHFGGLNKDAAMVNTHEMADAHADMLKRWERENPDAVLITDRGQEIDLNPYPDSMIPKPMPQPLPVSFHDNPISHHMTTLRSRSIFANFLSGDDVETFDNYYGQATSKHLAKYLRRIVTSSHNNNLVRETVLRRRVVATLVDCYGIGHPRVTAMSSAAAAAVASSPASGLGQIAGLVASTTAGSIVPSTESLYNYIRHATSPRNGASSSSSTSTSTSSSLSSSSLFGDHISLLKDDYLADPKNDMYKCLHDPFNLRTIKIDSSSSSSPSNNTTQLTSQHKDFFLIDRQWGNHGHDLLTVTLRAVIEHIGELDAQHSNRLLSNMASTRYIPLPLSSLIITPSPTQTPPSASSPSSTANSIDANNTHNAVPDIPTHLIPPEALPPPEVYSKLIQSGPSPGTTPSAAAPAAVDAQHRTPSQTNTHRLLANPISLLLDDNDINEWRVRNQLVEAIPFLQASSVLNPAQLQEVTARIAAVINPRTIPLYTLYDHTFLTMVLESQLLDPLTRFTILFHPQVQNALFHLYHRRLPPIHSSPLSPSPQSKEQDSSTRVLEELSIQHADHLSFVPFLKHLNDVNVQASGSTTPPASSSSPADGSHDLERGCAYLGVLEYVYSFARRTHPLQPPLHASIDFTTIHNQVASPLPNSVKASDGDCDDDDSSGYASLYPDPEKTPKLLNRNLVFARPNEVQTISQRVGVVQKHLHELMDIVEYFYSPPKAANPSTSTTTATTTTSEASPQGQGNTTAQPRVSPYLLRLQEQEKRKARLQSAGFGRANATPNPTSPSSSPPSSSSISSSPSLRAQQHQSVSSLSNQPHQLKQPEVASVQQQAEWRGLMSLLWAPPGSPLPLTVDIQSPNYPHEASIKHSGGWKPFVDMTAGHGASHEFAFMPALAPGHLAQLHVKRPSKDITIGDQSSTSTSTGEDGSGVDGEPALPKPPGLNAVTLTPEQQAMAKRLEDRIGARVEALHRVSPDSYLDWSDIEEFDSDNDGDDDRGRDGGTTRSGIRDKRGVDRRSEFDLHFDLNSDNESDDEGGYSTRVQRREQLREQRLKMRENLLSELYDQEEMDNTKPSLDSSDGTGEAVPTIIPHDAPFLPFNFVFDDSPSLKKLAAMKSGLSQKDGDGDDEDGDGNTRHSSDVQNDSSVKPSTPLMADPISPDYIPLERLTHIEDIPLRFRKASLQTIQNIPGDKHSTSLDDMMGTSHADDGNLGQLAPSDQQGSIASTIQQQVLSKHTASQLLQYKDEYSQFEQLSFLYGSPSRHILYENRCSRTAQRQIALREQYFYRLRLISSYDKNRQNHVMDSVKNITASKSPSPDLIAPRTRPQAFNPINKKLFNDPSSRKSANKIFSQKTEFSKSDQMKYNILIHGVEDSWLPDDLKPLVSQGATNFKNQRENKAKLKAAATSSASASPTASSSSTLQQDGSSKPYFPSESSISPNNTTTSSTTTTTTTITPGVISDSDTIIPDSTTTATPLHDGSFEQGTQSYHERKKHFYSGRTSQQVLELQAARQERVHAAKLALNEFRKRIRSDDISIDFDKPSHFSEYRVGSYNQSIEQTKNHSSSPFKARKPTKPPKKPGYRPTRSFSTLGLDSSNSIQQ